MQITRVYENGFHTPVLFLQCASQKIVIFQSTGYSRHCNYKVIFFIFQQMIKIIHYNFM